MQGRVCKGLLTVVSILLRGKLAVWQHHNPLDFFSCCTAFRLALFAMAITLIDIATATMALNFPFTNVNHMPLSSIRSAAMPGQYECELHIFFIFEQLFIAHF